MAGPGLSYAERHRLATYAQRLLAATLHKAASAALGQTGALSYGWRTGFEFLVWNLLTSSPFDADTRAMREAIDLEELSQLAVDAGGWMTWSPVFGKLVFVPLPDWLDLYAAYAGRSPR